MRKLCTLITGHNLQVRRILAEPSAYATRPATAGSSNAIRPVGGQRMVDSGVPRGMQKITYVLHLKKIISKKSPGHLRDLLRLTRVTSDMR